MRCKTQRIVEPFTIFQDEQPFVVQRPVINVDTRIMKENIHPDLLASLEHLMTPPHLAKRLAKRKSGTVMSYDLHPSMRASQIR